MNEFLLIPVAYASPAAESAPASEAGSGAILEEGKTVDIGANTEVSTGAEKHSEGLSIQPSTVAFQALNFVILLVLLNLILYKPLTKLLADREKKIREGVENAEKAKISLEEASMIRHDMMKRANAETQAMMETARKSGEEMKAGILQEAHTQATKIVQSGHLMVETEKEKVVHELKAKAVQVIIKATEKILREKIDSAKDSKLIQESLNSYSV